MEPYINSTLLFLQDILAQLGVAEVSRPYGAMLVLYLSVIFLVLFLVFNLWWFGWRKKGSSSVVEGSNVAMDETAAEGLAPLAKLPIKSVRSGLEKTRVSLVGRLEALFKRAAVFSPELLEELEEVLVTSDFGMGTTLSLVKALEERFSGGGATSAEVYAALKEEIARRIKSVDCTTITTGGRPEVIMVVGVNGVGKTTTIGKLASHYRAKGRSVMLAAGDTFRAAAAEQLSIWAERAGADIVRHSEGGDPAAVTFDAARAAIARKSEILIVDTAGRLHTKMNLMEELKKVRRVLDREISGAPHQTLLVVDATTGQNAIVQAKTFQEAVHVDGIILTKLDGTAKGGVIVAICSELNIPVRFVGVGEGLHDLRPFDADEFVEALFGKDEVA